MKKALHSLFSLALVVAMLVGIVAASGVSITLNTAAEESAYIVIDNCDTTTLFGTSGQTDANEKKQGKTSLRFGGSSTLSIINSTAYQLDMPENWQDWYLEFWLYLDNVNRVTLSDSLLGISSTNGATGEIKFTKLGTTLKSGWNKIQVKLSSFAYTNRDKFITFDRISLTVKTSGTVTIRLDDICLSREAAASDKTELQEAVTKAATFDTTGGSTSNLSAFAAAKTRAEEALASATCSQREADVSAEVLNDAMNAFGFEGFALDDFATYGYIDFAAMTYSMMDGFRVVGGEQTTYSDRTTTQFTDQLLVNSAKKYVVSGCNDLRFSVTYFDGESGGLELIYGSDSGEKTALTVAFTGMNAWKTATVRVQDAALARSIDGFDLSVKATGGATVYVSRVDVKVITEDDLAESDPPAFADQTESNNIIGAGSIGYQMWFSAGDDGWVHWGEGTHPNPAPGNGNLSFDVYPYVQDYIDNGATLYPSDLGKLGDGSQSLLFTSKDPAVVETHFQWISEYGIDCMAVQRFGFGNNGAKIEDEDNHLLLVQEMAEKYDKTFYVMYDVSGKGELSYDEFYERITSDFVLNVEQSGVASSTAYAHADGKPVVCIWGISGDDTQTNYPKGETASRVVSWFRERGYFVIIGTPDNSYTTRTGVYLEPFTMADMISPWTVGRYAYNSYANWIRTNGAADIEFCETYDCEYQPVIFPGFSWIGMLHSGKPNAYPRMAGDFVWKQAVEYKALGAGSFYFAMFDEYDEGTAYMKGGSDYFDIPTEQYFVTYAVDGQWLSNDYYLRTAQKAIQLLKGETTDTTLNIPYSQGPIYWRNSFERRWTTWLEEEGDLTTQHTILMNIDVCAPLSRIMQSTDVDLNVKTYTGSTDFLTSENTTDIDTYATSREGTGIFRNASGAYTKSGEWAFQFSGKATSSKASAQFLLATTDIMISAAGLELDYSIYAVNSGGSRVFVDLVMDDNTVLSTQVPELSTARGKVGQWVNVSVTLPASLVGQHIKFISIAYQGAAGDFDAYIDDVILQSPGTEQTMLQTAISTATALESDSTALAEAIQAGTAVLNDSAATSKQQLAAMKAIDNVIRDEEIVVASEALLGDVDGNGKVNTSDARLTLQYAAGRIGSEALNLSVADVTKDGKVNTSDARRILQYAAGRITEW